MCYQVSFYYLFSILEDMFIAKTCLVPGSQKKYGVANINIKNDIIFNQLCVKFQLLMSKPIEVMNLCENIDRSRDFDDETTKNKMSYHPSSV